MWLFFGKWYAAKITFTVTIRTKVFVWHCLQPPITLLELHLSKSPGWAELRIRCGDEPDWLTGCQPLHCFAPLGIKDGSLKISNLTFYVYLTTLEGPQGLFSSPGKGLVGVAVRDGLVVLLIAASRAVATVGYSWHLFVGHKSQFSVVHPLSVINNLWKVPWKNLMLFM